MEKFIQNSIIIDAPAAKVWDALVNPEQTKKYMFGCEAVSDWKVGSPLLWNGIHEEKEVTYVKGEIVRIEPGKTLVYTAIDPNGPVRDVPENYLTITYNLVSAAGKTTLSVSQGDYSKVENGESRYNESYNNGQGWQPILEDIKKLVES